MIVGLTILGTPVWSYIHMMIFGEQMPFLPLIMVFFVLYGFIERCFISIE